MQSFKTEFYKSKALEYLSAIAEQKPIRAPSCIHELLTLAAACHYVSSAMECKDRSWALHEIKRLPFEALEARVHTRLNTTLGAIGKYVDLLCEITAGSYDAKYEEHLSVELFPNGNETGMNVWKGAKPPTPPA